MLIRDLESKTGLDRATIRYYEKEGLITPIRQENGYREYSQEDCENLLKIKLLRQLGMPLFKIKELQEGRADFTAAMESQLKQLEQQLQRTQQTMEVCSRIRQAESSYAGLNAAYYLGLLEQPYALKPVLPAFREAVRRERHPWRRYIARMIDIAIVTGVLEFIIIVILRIRPYNFGFVVNYVGLFLCVPVYAFCLHKWGTTPGKFVFGLRVESVNGGRLSMTDAMWREFNVLRFGMGYGIPFYGPWREYKSYKQYMDEATVDYDEDSEYFCDEFDRKKKIQLTAVIVICSMLICINLFDNAKPTHREDLTIEQFSENYNDYISQHKGIGLEIVRKMDIDGSWITEDYWELAANTPVDNDQLYQFHMEEGRIRSITYENTWEDPFGFTPLDNERFWVAYTLAASQDNISYFNLEGFRTKYREIMFSETPEGSFTYENICVTWQVDTMYTSFHTGTYFSRSDEYVSGKTSYVHLKFTVTVLDQ